MFSFLKFYEWNFYALFSLLRMLLFSPFHHRGLDSLKFSHE